MLHKPSFVEEEEGTEWNQRWFGRTSFDHPSLDFICPDLQRVGPSMMCNMLGERSRKSLQLLILRDLPHTYSCTYFYSKGNTKVETKRTLPILNTGESKLYSNKKWEVLEAPDIILFFYFFLFFCKDNPGYLPAVFCLWSQARPCGFILQLPWWCSSQLHHHLLIYHRSSCKVSAQIQQRALHKYYDKKNQIQPSLRWS